MVQPVVGMQRDHFHYQPFGRLCPIPPSEESAGGAEATTVRTSPACFQREWLMKRTYLRVVALKQLTNRIQMVRRSWQGIEIAHYGRIRVPNHAAITSPGQSRDRIEITGGIQTSNQGNDAVLYFAAKHKINPRKGPQGLLVSCRRVRATQQHWHLWGQLVEGLSPPNRERIRAADRAKTDEIRLSASYQSCQVFRPVRPRLQRG